MIYWAVIYFIAREYFKFSREWAAPLASGISICGVSAAIATGGAIRARRFPIMVSSLVVIFAVGGKFLPRRLFGLKIFLSGPPAWFGGGLYGPGSEDRRSGLWFRRHRGCRILSKAPGHGRDQLQRGLDGHDRHHREDLHRYLYRGLGLCPGDQSGVPRSNARAAIKAVEIWERFPKFVLGYVLTFFLMLIICLASPGALKTANAGWRGWTPSG